jgi:hypothetical protein
MLNVQPYSMARQDPNVQAQARSWSSSAPALPAMAQRSSWLGPAFNIEGAMNLVLREMGIEEGDELINSPCSNSASSNSTPTSKSTGKGKSSSGRTANASG